MIPDSCMVRVTHESMFPYFSATVFPVLGFGVLPPTMRLQAVCVFVSFFKIGIFNRWNNMSVDATFFLNGIKEGSKEE